MTCICIRCIIRDMKLEAYLTSKEMTDEAFASAIGCSQSQVNRLRNRKAFPKPDMVSKIHVATSGAVSATDWYDLPKGRIKRSIREVAE